MSGINLSHIENKFQLLLKRVKILHGENQKLEQKVQAGMNEIERQQKVIAEMEQKIKMLQMTTPSENGVPTDTALKKEMRATLKSYIHEIDNCIALLNK